MQIPRSTYVWEIRFAGQRSPFEGTVYFSCYLACILLYVSLRKPRMCAKTPYGNKKKELFCLNQHFIVYFLLAYVDTQMFRLFE